VVPTGATLVQGTVTGASQVMTVTLTVGSQTYTPAVVNGAFQQQVQLSGAGTWAVQAAGLDAYGAGAQTRRNLIADAPVSPSAYTAADATLALRIALGLAASDAGTLAKYDLGPMVDGAAVSDGTIDIQDAVLVLRLALGQNL
jgi:hypothetical protein